MRAYVAVTDPVWLRRLREIRALEANFWQPRPAALNQLPGDVWLFKVRGQNAIAGFGVFAYYTVLPAGTAWQTFGEANGVASYAEMRSRISALRRDENRDDNIGCVVLEGISILEEDRYVAAPADWKPNTVRGEYYDLAAGEGARAFADVRAQLNLADAGISQMIASEGFGKERIILPRLGQGAFRLMVIDAYDRRCAITGERTLPALEAAHIRPYGDSQSHDIRNGILMRSDIHALFDQGYVTIDTDLRFRVSPRIRDEFNNGVVYYNLDGGSIRPPSMTSASPDRDALEWHSKQVFRG